MNEQRKAQGAWRGARRSQTRWRAHAHDCTGAHLMLMRASRSPAATLHAAAFQKITSVCSCEGGGLGGVREKQGSLVVLLEHLLELCHGITAGACRRLRHPPFPNLSSAPPPLPRSRAELEVNPVTRGHRTCRLFLGGLASRLFEGGAASLTTLRRLIDQIFGDKPRTAHCRRIRDAAKVWGKEPLEHRVYALEKFRRLLYLLSGSAFALQRRSDWSNGPEVVRELCQQDQE